MVDSIVEAFIWVLDLVIPDKDSRYRRVQRLGCVMFAGLGLLAAVVLLLDLFAFGNS